MMFRSYLLRGIAMFGALACVATSVSAQQPPRPVPLPGMYDGGYLVFQSADSAFKYWLDARAQVDAADYLGATNSMATGVILRRVRLGVKSTLYRNWLGEIDVDFAGDAVEVKDLWIGYQGWSNSLLRVGNFKEPFSLETLTSSKYITFLERSYIDNFSPDRHIGLAYSRWGSRWQVSGGVFGQGSGDIDATGQNQGFGLTARATVAPLLKDRQLIHLGAAVSRRTPDADATPNRLRIRARPETNVNKARFLSTGRITNVDYELLYNGELAVVQGPFSVQAEATKADVHRLGGLSTGSFWGGYAAVSFFLTGESRPYIASEGEWDRVFPRSSKGAWEVAARVSTMDLDDTSIGVDGGKGTNITLGLNWYINANFKFMADYVHVNLNGNAVPDQGTAPLVGGDKFDIVQLRASLAL
jgi:phosphate-selective porin OprO and OprP